MSQYLMPQAAASQSALATAGTHAGNLGQPEPLVCSSQHASGQQLCANQATTPPDAPAHKRPRHGSNSGASSDGSFNLPVTPAAAGVSNLDKGDNATRVAATGSAYLDKDGKPSGILGPNLSGAMNNNVPGHNTPLPASTQAPTAAVCSNGMLQSGTAPDLDCFLQHADGFSAISSSRSSIQLCGNSPAPASTGLVQLLQQQLQSQNAELHKRLESADGATAAAQLMLQYSQQQHHSMTQQLQEERHAKVQLEIEQQSTHRLLHAAQQDICTLQAEKAALEVVLDHLLLSGGAASGMISAPQQQQQQQPVMLATPHQGPRAAMKTPAAAALAPSGQQCVLGTLANAPAAHGGGGPCLATAGWTQGLSRLNPQHREHTPQVSSVQAARATDGGSAAEQAAQRLVEPWRGGGGFPGTAAAGYAPDSVALQGSERQVQPHRVNVMELPLEDVVGQGDLEFNMALMPPLSPSDLGF